MLQLERLEDRLTPTVNSSFSGTALTLTYSGVNNDSVTVQFTSPNAVSVTGNGGTTVTGTTSGTVTDITVTGSTAATGQAVIFDLNDQVAVLTGDVTITALQTVTVTDNSGTPAGTLTAAAFSDTNSTLVTGSTTTFNQAVTTTSTGETVTGFSTVNVDASLTGPTAGTIDIGADDISIDTTIGFIDSPSGLVILNTATPSQVINLGTLPITPGAQLGLTDAELAQITANQLTIGGASNTGGIIVTAPITDHNYTILELQTDGAITNSGSFDVDVAGLALEGGTGIGTSTAPMVVSVDGLVAHNSTSGGIFANSTGELTIGFTGEPFQGVVDNSAGDAISLTVSAGDTFTITGSGESVASNNGPITINADAMDLGQSIDAGTNTVTLTPVTTSDAIDLGTNPAPAGTLGLSDAELGEVTAGQLTIGSAADTGDINITANIASHNYTILELLAGAAITDASANSLGGTDLALSAGSGIGTNSSPVTTAVSNLAAENATSAGIFITNTGDLTIGFAGEPFQGVHDTGAGDPIQLSTNAGTIFSINGDGESITSNSGPITISADDMDLVDPIDAGTGIVTLLPVTTTQVIDLGTSVNPAPAGTLGLSDAELGEVTASLLRVGSTSNTGGIQVSAAGIGTTNAADYANTLSLITGGTITQTGAGTLASTNLALQALGNISLDTNANMITNLAGTGFGTFDFLNSTALTIGPAVDSVTGVTAADDISVSSDNTLTVDADVTSTGGSNNVVLQAGPALTIETPSTVKAGGTITINGDFNDTASTDITLAGAALQATSAVINGNTNNDTFNLDLATTTPITINGNGSAAAPTQSVSFAAGSATLSQTYAVGDTLNLNDESDESAGTTFITTTFVQRVGNDPITLNGIGTLNLTTGTNTETVSIFGTPASQTTIDADGNLVMQVSGTADFSSLIVNGASSGSISIGINSTGLGSLLQVKGGSAGNTFVVFGTGGGAGVQLNDGSGNDVNWLLGSASGSFIVANGGTGTDAFIVTGSDGTVDADLGTMVVNGTSGTGDQLVVEDVDNTADHAYTVESGSVTQDAMGPLSYSGIDVLSVLMGQGTNTMNVYSQAAGTTTVIYGDGGSDNVYVTVDQTSNYNNLAFVGGSGVEQLHVLDNVGNSKYTPSTPPTSSGKQDGAIEVLPPGGSLSIVAFANVDDVLYS